MAFWEGVLAGYGIAIPVGAIAILIIDVSLRRGFSYGSMAGAGAATVDFIYALIAVLAGATLAAILLPYSTTLRLVSAVVLILLGAYGIWRTWQRRDHALDDSNSTDQAGHLRTYGQFFGLTLLNPLTIVYFTALVLSWDPEMMRSSADPILFVIGAGLASLSWQTLLAGAGASARRFLSPRFQLYASLIGNFIVLGLGLRILLQLAK